MRTPKPNIEILNAALLGFEEQKRRIDEQMAEIRLTLVGGSKTVTPTPDTTAGQKKRKRKLSAAGRAAIVAALKRRWAEKKKSAAR